MGKFKILIVDDDNNVREFLHWVFTEEGFEVFKAPDGDEALNILDKESMDVVVLDVQMPGRDGIDTLKEIGNRNIQTKVIIMTGYATIQMAVDTMKLGAFDYIVKPFENDELVFIVNQALSGYKKPQNINRIEPRNENPFGIIGNSHAMKDIFQLIKKVAIANTTVLITGESGTGKSLLAQAIHNLSPQRNSPFITINCAAIPENLLESELFGHKRGAFTGAVSSQTGKFELANNGTIFLDEISTLSLQTQAKLLRVIQQKEFEKVGGEHTIKVDVRIITATNEHLDIAVSKGTFREDLFYRLNVFMIKMPSLWERKEDIPFLVDFFINNFNEKLRKNVIGVTSECMNHLINYAWPGNVRELENVIERAMILEEDCDLGIASLPDHIRLIQTGSDNKSSMDDIITVNKLTPLKEAQIFLEDIMINNAIKEYGSIVKAAQFLQINPSTIYRKINRGEIRIKTEPQ